MADMPKIENVLRAKNITQLAPWQSVHATITKPMVTGLGPADIKDSALAMGFAHISEPLVIIDSSHKHPFDQWIYLIGADVFSEFDADVEYTMGEEVFKINYPCCIFIPKDEMHCPLIVTRVGKPIIFVDARITPEASIRT